MQIEKYLIWFQHLDLFLIYVSRIHPENQNMIWALIGAHGFQTCGLESHAMHLLQNNIMHACNGYIYIYIENN